MICPNCGQEFDPADRAAPTAREGSITQIIYCSWQCKKSATNKRNYARRAAERIAAVIERRRSK